MESIEVDRRAAMKRNRLLGAVILFLTAILAIWPIALEFGVRPAAAPTPAWSIPGHLGPNPFAETTETVWSCEEFGGYAGMRGNQRERVCGPKKGLHASAPRPATRQGGMARGGPLDKAVFASIAGSDPVRQGDLLEVPAPDEMLSPEELAAATGAGVGGSWDGPQIPGAGPLPANLLADIGPTADESPVDPGTPVVPLPGALPLMLTGFAAIGAAVRARRRAAGFRPSSLQG